MREKLQKRIRFTRSEKSVCNPEKIGVSLEKNRNNSKSLIEQSDIREHMINYLQAVNKYRDESRPIIYIVTGQKEGLFILLNLGFYFIKI